MRTSIIPLKTVGPKKEKVLRTLKKAFRTVKKYMKTAVLEQIIVVLARISAC